MGSYALPRPVIRRKIRGLLPALVVGVLGAVATLVAPPAAHAAENTIAAEHARRRGGAERPLLRHRHRLGQTGRLGVHDDRGP